ncbi:marine proteobacterial sortase target protein [Pleionea sediminis]|uniref:marine proteobacterial sortase target protein n=1 Tax=Pleionea sediminis TaxID=2569479 RepID=UPI0013DDC06E|nr:marine proteobacterial sortase target protein [Pleionea sediminis]
MFNYLVSRCSILLSVLCINLYAIDELGGGTLRFTGEHSTQEEALLVDTKADFSVSGLVLRAKVTQVFKNESSDWVEGTYFFPLPEKSAVDALTVKMGERLIVGEIREKKEAKRLYQEAKKAGKKASLVEQHRPNVFSNRIANIGPYEQIEVTIEYQQDIEINEFGELSFRFPMTMTKRYTPSSKLIEDFGDLKNGFQWSPSDVKKMNFPQKDGQSEGGNVSLTVNLEAGLSIDYVESSTHELTKHYRSPSSRLITLSHSINKADRDFILKWKFQSGQLPRAALFGEEFEGEQYISLLVIPPKVQDDSLQLARELIFVLDTSGSMSGESIRQAKEALVAGVKTLKAGDWFNVIEFNNRTDALYPSSKAFSSERLSDALSYIDGLDAGGGTEMYSAMSKALLDTNSNNLVRQIVFLTDGAISNEAQLFRLIQSKLGRSRLFTVGIGSAPNEFFMKRVAKFGRGTFTFIGDHQTAKEKMEALFSKIEKPVLTNIKINWPAHVNADVWPKRVPDLYAGEPLWIKAKVNDVQGSVDIHGQLADQLWQTHLTLNSSESKPGIAKLWARQKIASIMNQSLHGRLNDKSRQDATQTALKFHLMSRFTSLIAVDKTPSRTSEILKSKQVAGVVPKGSASNALRYPQTALNIVVPPKYALFILLMGCVIILALRIKKHSTHQGKHDA